MSDDALERLHRQRQNREQQRHEIRQRVEGSLDEVDCGQLAPGTGEQAIRRAFARGAKPSA